MFYEMELEFFYKVDVVGFNSMLDKSRKKRQTTSLR